MSDSNFWQTYALTDLAHYHNGYAFKPDDWRTEGTKIIRIEQLNKPNGRYDYFSGDYPSVNHIEDGDLIFSWSATLKVAIWKHGCGVLNQHLFRVDEKDGFDKHFLYYLLDFHMDALSGGSHGSTMKHIKRGELQTYKVKVPPLPVQKRIAQVLISLDNQIDATQALIDKYTAIKQGMMVDLFSRGIDPETKALRPTFEEAPELYHKTPLGMLPKGWDATPLRDVCDLQVGYAFKSSEFVSEGVSLLRGENVGYGKPSWKDRKCLSHSAAENYEEYLLGDSDIVIGMDRTFTKSGVKISKILDTDLPCLLVQRVGRFVPFGVVDGLIEHIVFQNHYLRELMVAEQGMDIPHLSKDDILSPLVAIPECPKEAVLLTAVLDNVTGKLHAEQAFLEKMKLQKNGLMQDLLTGKIPVPA
ncbi:restriction endonuclease subunit S [Vibrio owensii]|uniref:restriction endonuclease subunit S n=1 Tax=Vibrio owensii TaxID=696485 RepID=UPI00221F97F3|nr:restriction endonuclease subunit S [Vibrio owensii]